MRPILVIGSSNTDLVLRVPELPAPGQTVLGSDFARFHGGKGANQAVAARRAGGEVRFLAVLGDDDFGEQSAAMLDSEGIDSSLIKRVAGASGVALISVADNGENSIAVAPGANAALSVATVQQHADDIAAASILLLQLESPIDAVTAAASIAASADVPCVLNPAPASDLSDALLASLFCITPNEIEAELLTGVAVTDDDSAIAAAARLQQRGVANVIVTRGANGALLCNNEGAFLAAAPEVGVVDTTGAGDTFNGVLVAALAEGQAIRAATALAVAAASLAVQAEGAIPSIPERAAYDPVVKTLS